MSATNPPVSIVARELPVLHTNFIGDWYRRRDEPALRDVIPGDVVAVSVGFAHTHDALCTTLSELWRVVAADVIQSLLSPADRLVCWLSGPTLQGEFANVLRHVWDSDGARHQLFAAAKTEPGPGYVTAKVSVEYARDWFDSLMADREIDLQDTVSLRGAVAPEASVPRLLGVSTLSTPLVLDLLKEVDLLIDATSHFEGIHLLSQKISAEHLIRRVRAGVPSFIEVQ